MRAYETGDGSSAVALDGMGGSVRPLTAAVGRCHIGRIHHNEPAATIRPSQWG